MSEKIEVRASPVGGLGIFARVALAAGERVREFVLGREVTAEAPLRPEHGELPEYCPLIDGRFYLVGFPDRHFNHSCDPNCYKRFGPERIDVMTRRAIEAGEELCFDYLINNPGGDSWPCSCGAERCRGMTGHGFFTLPEPIQREYRSLLAPWFVARFEKELRALGEAR